MMPDFLSCLAIANVHACAIYLLCAQGKGCNTTSGTHCIAGPIPAPELAAVSVHGTNISRHVVDEDELLSAGQKCCPAAGKSVSSSKASAMIHNTNAWVPPPTGNDRTIKGSCWCNGRSTKPASAAAACILQDHKCLRPQYCVRSVSP